MAEQMESCPQCKTLLEPWEVTCHACDTVVSLDAVPIVPDVAYQPELLKEAFQNWFNDGKLDFAQGRFEDAAVDFKEALKRLKGMEGVNEKVLEVRKYLAESLEKAGKPAEAAQQYAILAEAAGAGDLKARCLEKVEQLWQASADLTPLAEPGSENQFFPLARDEHRFMPLYCWACRRLLNEAVVFGFRRGGTKTIRCFCGFEGQPVAKHDAVYRQALRQARGYTARKSMLIKSASQTFAGGRNKVVAGLLALFLGNFGIHKWYLGERAAGMIYFLFSWTFIPWIVALFEAIHYFAMTQVSWNLNYNVDRVLASIGPAPEEEPGPPHEVFSMEITDDPEDYLDDLSGSESASRGGR